MVARYPHNVIVDTGFWIGYYEPRDQYHGEAMEKAAILDSVNVLLPWPVLYETLNSRFVRRAERVRHFERFVSRPSVALLNDAPFREDAYKETRDAAILGKRPLSLTDVVIRLMLQSTNVKIHYILTFNQRDYVDVCTRRSIGVV